MEFVEKTATTKSSGDTENGRKSRRWVQQRVNIRTIVPHELERLGEEGEEQIAMQGKKRVGRGERNQPPAYELRDVSLIRGRRSTFALPKAAIGY